MRAGLRAKACKALASKGDHDPSPRPPVNGDCSRKELKGRPRGRVDRGRCAIAASQYSVVKTALKLTLAAPFALALTGCATTRYVPTYCLDKTQYDQLKSQEPPKVHNQLNGDASHDVGPLAGSAIRLRAYGDALLGVLGGCVDPSSK